MLNWRFYMNTLAVKPTKEQIEREFWHRGNLDFKLHDGQKLIDKTLQNLKGQLIVLNCSRQFGKTYWGVSKAIGLAIRKKNARIRIGTAFLTDLTELIIPAFDTILDDCPESIKPKYKVQGSKYVFPNGSEIKLVGLDKSPNGLRGNSLDLILLEEAGFISNLDYIYTSVIVPTTTHRPECKIILISTPPSTPAHPFADTYVPRAELEGSYASFTIFDNPMLGPETILRLMNETGCVIPKDGTAYGVIEEILKTKKVVFPESWVISTSFKREYLSQFILDDDLALVREWSASNDVYIQEVKRDEYYPYYHKLVGMDMGRKDHTALIFGYYDFKRAALIIEDELTMYGPGWTTITLKDAIKAKELELWTEDMKAFRRVADTNNPGLLTDLSSLHNLFFMPVKKEASLEQMVNRVREWVKQGRIIIHPRCKMLIGCLKYGIWDKKRQEFARSKIYGHFDHFAALQYLLIHTPSTTNPIPATHGHANHRSWLGNIDKTGASKNAQTINKLFGPKRSKL